MAFDPATLQNAPVVLVVGPRELVRAGDTPTPAFRVDLEFAGLHTTSWVTDTGEVVREERTLAVEADAATFRPAEGQADVVTFSYSLTMIPDWFTALETALRNALTSKVPSAIW